MDHIANMPTKKKKKNPIQKLEKHLKCYKEIIFVIKIMFRKDTVKLTSVSLMRIKSDIVHRDEHAQ